MSGAAQPDAPGNLAHSRSAAVGCVLARTAPPERKITGRSLPPGGLAPCAITGGRRPQLGAPGRSRDNVPP